MYDLINQTLTVAFEFTLRLLGPLPGWLKLVVLAVPAAVFALGVVRYTTDQVAVARLRGKIRSHLMELWLYRDDPSITLRSQGELFKANLRYVMHLALPLVLMAVPFLLVLAQVEAHFAYRGLGVGESALITARFKNEPAAIDLQLPAALIQETPALRIERSAEVVWRVRALESGSHAVAFSTASGEFTRVLSANSESTRAVPTLYRADDPWVLLSPLGSLPETVSLRSLEIAYPASGSRFAGLSSASWIFVAAALLIGFGLRRPLRVEI